MIELLLVIAVIAVLMAIMIPSLRAARELAVGSACSANLKSLGLAYTMSAGDYIIPDVLAADTGFGEYGAVTARHQRLLFKLTDIQSPSDKYIFCESALRPSGNFNYDHGGWTFAPWVNQGWWDNLGAYHNNSAVFGFADGHAERHTWSHKQTWQLFRYEIGAQAPSDPPLAANRDIEWCGRRYLYLSPGERP